ncbi:hypothetical protein AB0894_15230, partial [Streptomyces sp. NPDC047916]
MLTVHAAPLVLPVGAAGVDGGAVAVDGDRIVAVGPYDVVTAAHPAARIRRWPGVLTPGLRQWDAVPLLTRCYHPDPREADELGEEPLTGADFERLAARMDEPRRAGSVRRGLQRMLRHGTTHVAGGFADPAVRTAVGRASRGVRMTWRSWELVAEMASTVAICGQSCFSMPSSETPGAAIMQW